MQIFFHVLWCYSFVSLHAFNFQLQVYFDLLIFTGMGRAVNLHITLLKQQSNEAPYMDSTGNQIQ